MLGVFVFPFVLYGILADAGVPSDCNEEEFRLFGGLVGYGYACSSLQCMALGEEINRWSGFERALRKSDKEVFDELMDMCRSYASESGNATNLIVFEPM